MKLRLGMSPISWSNDDLPQLGGDTPLEVCLSETREAGFVGTETGGKFPKEAGALSSVLAEHDLALVSGWYSGTLINNDLDSELERIADQLALFKAVGASVIVYGETYETVQNRQERPLSSRPKLDDYDVAAYGRRLTALAEHCAGEGVPLTFHHHMGTAVETEAALALGLRVARAMDNFNDPAEAALARIATAAAKYWNTKRCPFYKFWNTC
jgi:inosose dehydratase